MLNRSKNRENNIEIKKVNFKWTEEMDDIYIEAMLEQLENGNKVDGTFTSHAYANMVKMCTEKIGFPFDKNHLKNRVKTLKENFTKCFDLFHGLSGFGWNPVTELFEAEAEAWETLIKANPKAAKWRYTKVHSYGKLYQLFSKDRANGKGASSAKDGVRQWATEESHDDPTSIDLETSCEPSSPTSVSNSISALKMLNKSKSKETNIENKKVNFKWTEEMDDIYIDAMLEQLVNGSKVDGTFTPLAYANMVKICTEKIGLPFDKNHLKNRIKTLKENFTRCFDLFHGLSGFVWNPVTELFEAEAEAWETLIKANRTAAKWRYTKVHSYGKLYVLFSKDRANSKGASTVKERVRQLANEDSHDDPTSIDLETSYEPSSPTSISNSISEEAKNSRKKARTEELFEKQIEVLNSAINNMAEVLKQGYAIAEKVAQIAEKGLVNGEKGRSHCYSEAEVFDELVKIDVPDHLQLDAFLFLNQNQQRVRAFFGVPVQRRRELLMKMMLGQNSC